MPYSCGRSEDQEIPSPLGGRVRATPLREHEIQSQNHRTNDLDDNPESRGEEFESLTDLRKRPPEDQFTSRGSQGLELALV